MGLPEDAERSQAQRFEQRFMSYRIAFTHCPYAIALPYSRGGRSVAQHNYSTIFSHTPAATIITMRRVSISNTKQASHN